MDLLTTLHRSGGIVALARQLAIEPQAAAGLVEPLLPLLTSAFREVRAEAGFDGLLQLVDNQGGVSLAADIMGMEPADPARGVGLLARLRIDANALAAVSDSAGTDRRSLAGMLPLLAMLAAGYLAGIELSRPDSHPLLAELLDDGADSVPVPGS